MAIETIGTALAVAGLRPLFDTCRDLHVAFKLTQSFGKDFVQAKRRLRVQTTRFEMILELEHPYLMTTMNPDDPKDPMTSAIRDQLTVLIVIFDDINKLLEKYHVQELDRADTATGGAVQLSCPSSAKSTLQRMSKSFTHIIQRLRPHSADLVAESKGNKSATTASVSGGQDDRQVVASQRSLSLENTAMSMPMLRPLSSEPSSILNTVHTAAYFDSQLETARRYQRNEIFGRKISWLHEDHDLLFKLIDHLRTGNEDLENLLQHKSTRNPSLMLPYSQTGPSRGCRSAIQARSSLNELHNTLASANSISGYQDSLVIDFHMAEDLWETTHEVITQETYLDFRSPTYIFILRAMDIGEITATQILAEEIVQADLGYNDAPLTPISNLKAAIGATDAAAAANVYEPLGSVSSPGSCSRTAHLFYDTRHQWISTQSLQDVLLSEKFKQHVRLIERSQLARLITMGVICLASVMDSTYTDLCPSTVRYYRPDREDDHGWDADPAFILSPYLRFGFGSRRPQRTLGTSGLSRRRTNRPVDLGLLLFQIGVFRQINYDSSAKSPLSQHAARAEAIKSMHELDCNAGPALSEIVKACLDWQGDSSASIDSQQVFVQHVFEHLERFEQELEERPASPIRSRRATSRAT